jgi:hypothetical protein
MLAWPLPIDVFSYKGVICGAPMDERHFAARGMRTGESPGTSDLSQLLLQFHKACQHL